MLWGDPASAQRQGKLAPRSELAQVLKKSLILPDAEIKRSLTY